MEPSRTCAGGSPTRSQELERLARLEEAARAAREEQQRRAEAAAAAAAGPPRRPRRPGHPPALRRPGVDHPGARTVGHPHHTSAGGHSGRR